MPQSFSLTNGRTRKSISPEELASCIFNWSKDSALEYLKELSVGVYQSSDLAKTFVRKPFGAHSQFMAINMAAYMFYASALNASKDALDRLFDGLIKELSTVKLNNGEPLHEAHVKYLQSSFSEYVQANLEDFASSRKADADIYRSDVTAIAKKFFELIPKLYRDVAISEVDRSLIGHFVADMPFHIYKALKEESLITWE